MLADKGYDSQQVLGALSNTEGLQLANEGKPAGGTSLIALAAIIKERSVNVDTA